MAIKRPLAIALGAAVAVGAAAAIFLDLSGDPIGPVRKHGRTNSLLYRSDRGDIWRIETLSVSSASIWQVADLLKPLEKQGWAKQVVAIPPPPQDNRFLLPGATTDEVLLVSPDKRDMVSIALFEGGAVTCSRLHKLDSRERLALWLKLIPQLETSVPEHRISP